MNELSKLPPAPLPSESPKPVEPTLAAAKELIGQIGGLSIAMQRRLAVLIRVVKALEAKEENSTKRIVTLK